MVKRVFCTQSKKRFPMCIIEVYDSTDKLMKMFSAGNNEFGVLAQGKDIKE